jgi:hypothetical protein
MGMPIQAQHYPGQLAISYVKPDPKFHIKKGASTGGLHQSLVAGGSS